ncbi:putative RNA-binding Zn ribbon-like protein [Nocardiopsis sp. Huas11]|uniref:ABATE domain-containing protein n=1 Tax=Nocardiopsis sp. Huas11 TaxID=2183912 RepID=UPI000EAEDBE0|nr:CGNR zinc finger domain-containing protein [Nocardiopsis sp. Huas11]RKS10080.1 putative RNA-binding Zn ribbon-like protein [Nocardiopsis sp. Huas11]
MPAEPVAVAFANTRSSPHRDRIAELDQWRAWCDARPGLKAVGRAVDADGLTLLRAARDDVQEVLRAAAAREDPDPAVVDRLPALTRGPAPGLAWHGDRYELTVPEGGSPAAALAHHLAGAAMGLVVTGPPLAVCRGQGCLKVFVATRADRRWCDGAACGNRARVRSHHRKRSGPDA